MTTEASACPELSPEPSRRTAANRANAQHSTGPKTPEGKARVARNALRHGFRARLIIDNPVERGDGSRFGALLADLVAELSPVGVLEEFAVETMAVCIWRLRHTVQEELNGAGMTERDIYFAEMDKAWEETGNKEGYPPPKRDDPALASDQRITLLIRYEAHLYRQYRLALKDLQSLQSARLGQSSQPLQSPEPDPPTLAFEPQEADHNPGPSGPATTGAANLLETPPSEQPNARQDGSAPQPPGDPSSLSANHPSTVNYQTKPISYAPSEPLPVTHQSPITADQTQFTSSGHPRSGGHS